MKRIILTIMTILFLIPYSLTVVHGLYVAPLQNNTIFADDFDQNYTNGIQTRNLASGWGYVDNATGGSVHINNTNYQSCCKSLSLTSPIAGGAKFDIDKRLARLNTTRIIQASVWFAISANMPGDGSQPDLHIAIEQWDRANHFESLIEFNYLALGGVTCVRPDIFSGVSDTVEPYCLEPYDNSGNTFNRQYWHHVIIQSDVINHKFLYCDIDGITFSACNNSDHDITPDTTFQNQYFINLIRFEMAVFNKGTAPGTPYFVWFDNIQIIDITPGQPSIIQFAINGVAIILLMFMGIIGILYYLRIGDRLMFGKGKGLFGSHSVIKYKEQRATTAEQEAKRMVKTIMIILVIGAILTAFGLYFAGFI